MGYMGSELTIFNRDSLLAPSPKQGEGLSRLMPDVLRNMAEMRRIHKRALQVARIIFDHGSKPNEDTVWQHYLRLDRDREYSGRMELSNIDRTPSFRAVRGRSNNSLEISLSPRHNPSIRWINLSYYFYLPGTFKIDVAFDGRPTQARPPWLEALVPSARNDRYNTSINLLGRTYT
ncbi:MAG: hypothetical protein ACMG6E_01565, partial [Candidatus Roizmanbacteria bacterium]